MLRVWQKFTVALIMLFLCLPVGDAVAAKAHATKEPQLTAQAAILVELNTGRAIYEKNADERRYPASMTKMMTAILAIEHGNLRDNMSVSSSAAATEDSALGLTIEEMLTMEEAVTGMMLVSDNGAAVAIAEHISGNTQAFAELMNDKARQIGCQDTHFVNPNGLPNEEHYSTARDMAKIAAYGLKNKKFADIVRIQKAAIHYVLPPDKFTVVENTNELLQDFDGAIGIKTGWTRAAGGCLAAAAKRGGVTLIAIIMGAPDVDTRFADARELLDYGFGRVKMHRGVSAARTQTGIWVKDGTEYKVTAGPVTDVDYPLIDGETPDKYSYRYDLPRFLTAPAVKGDKVGKLVLQYDGVPVGDVDVALRETVPQGFSFLSFFFVGLLDLLSTIF